ncbi:MAG: DNA recombination protein RmuC [Bacteroidales bacterium]|nr:DNA recombination protein RmuC [Bacteroidales bacterium]MBR3285619.1 DNA recombination protein RmuC [Bacteroidales bacterium]MBR5432198.1 DNA recombination protein RmuC [Bacteroidales bacterium]
MDALLQLILAFAVGLLLTAVIAFIIAGSVVKKRVKSAQEAEKARGEESLQMQKTLFDADLAHAREREDALRGKIDEIKGEAAARIEEVKKDYTKRNEEALAALREKFDETMAKVSAQVKNETSEMLKARQKEFSEASNESLGQIMAPLKENIAELKKRMEEDNKEQGERNAEMRERIKTLLEHSDMARKSADELAEAFKHGSKMQGDWGETILEELLSSQGLREGVHFDSQPVIMGPDGKPVKNESGGIMRPDIILHLDEKREVIIDSKVSLTAYVDYVNAETAAERQQFLKAHVDSILKHVNELAEKDYSSYIKSPKVSAGYVIMFVPNVGALWSALNADPGLWRKAADKNVYIADEQSLYGALKIVSATWTQVVQAQNHERVYELAQEMIERVGMFMEKYKAVGDALNKAQTEYIDAGKKLDPKGQSILNTSAKLIKLGAKNSEKHPIPALQDIDDIPSLES